VIFLDHDMFNLHELSSVIDLGVVWNSTVCLELGVLGITCVVSSWYGALDFPVDHLAPKDRADFEKHLLNAKNIRPSAETARRSAALIQYLKSEDVATPYRYTIRKLTNKHLRERGWIAADLKRYRQVGDPYVKLLADRVEQSFIG